MARFALGTRVCTARGFYKSFGGTVIEPPAEEWAARYSGPGKAWVAWDDACMASGGPSPWPEELLHFEAEYQPPPLTEKQEGIRRLFGEDSVALGAAIMAGI